MKAAFCRKALLAAALPLLVSASPARQLKEETPGPWNEHGRLEVSSDRRRLAYRDGTPFFWLGDTAWQLFKELSREEVGQYLEARKRMKFNVVMAVLLAEYHDGLEASPPAGLGPNYYGHEPLIDQDPARPRVLEGGSAAEPNDYWDHVDYVLSKAEEEGLYVGVLPCWGWNYVNGGGGRAGLQIFNERNALSYGKFLGERFRDRPNVIWIIGGDDDPLEHGDFRSIYRAMVEGIVQGVSGEDLAWDQEHEAWDELLMTFHPRGGRSSSKFFHFDPWLDFNFLQSGHGVLDNPNSYRFILHDRELEPVKPVIEGEPRYEDHPAWQSGFREKGTRFRDFDLRQAAYWSVFAGSYGFTYGHHSIWQFKDPEDADVSWPDRSWQEALARPGAQQMQFLKALIESRPPGEFRPDQSLIASRNPEDARHLRALRGDSWACIYDPYGISFEVDLGNLQFRQALASWFNPRDGSLASIGTIDSSGVREFDPPGPPGRGNDWVLVLEPAR